MGSAAKRECARGERCVGYDAQVGRPEKLSRYNADAFCPRCQQKHRGAYVSPDNSRWIGVAAQAIETALPDNKASVWDLFALDPENGGHGRKSDLGKVLRQLDSKTLAKLRDWLDERRDRAIEEYGDPAWHALRTRVGLAALLTPLPDKMELVPDTKDGLPFQIRAVRTDGKTWYLNIPIRAELLRLLPRHFGERGYAKLLGMSRKAYRRLRAAAKREELSLDAFTAEDLYRIVYGKKRGPDRKP